MSINKKKQNGTKPSRFDFSEEEMANAFQKYILREKKISGIGVFGAVYREISCKQGKPDFIAISSSKNPDPNNQKLFNIGHVGAWILSVLKPSAPRTLKYLIAKSQYAEASIKKTINELLCMGYIRNNDNGSYYLGDFAQFLKTEVWALELKLANAKRAVFQAQQYKAFADKTIIIGPPCQIKNYTRFDKAMERWGIGLASYDPIAESFKIIKKPRKTKPFSKEHHMYAISQLLASENCEI